MNTISTKSIEIIHRASQYLTAAAICFLEHKADDSHTNFGWNLKRKAFYTRNLNGNELYLALTLENFRLEFYRHDNFLVSKAISGSSHDAILSWLSHVFKDLNFKDPYTFNFHYELPYEPITYNFVFEHIDKKYLQSEIKLRNQAYNLIKETTIKYDNNAEVRTWPHHFDTGTFINAGNNIFIGIGLAIPDTMINEYYYYVTGWKKNEMISVSNLPKLKNGKWVDGAWKGATLIADNSSDKNVEEFISEAIKYLQK